jgi:dolichol-phosphate mannosyltransferase
MKPPHERRSEVSVVLPSYNERQNIAEAIERIHRSLGDQLREIIVVDDDSPDGTWRIVQELHHPRYRVIRRIGARGLASALARGTREATGRIVVWMDCDLGIPPEEIPRLVRQMDRYDVAIGSRYAPGGEDRRPRFRAFLSVLINVFARLVLGGRIRDYTSGFIAIRREALQAVPLVPEGFGEYFMDLVYRCRRRGFKITEIGYVYSTRKGGVSKLDERLSVLLRYGFRYGLAVLQIRLGTYHPISH